MYKFLLSFFIVLFAIQLSSGQNTKTTSQMSLIELGKLQWKTTDGLPYERDFSGAYSVETFMHLEGNQYAFLSKTEKKILIFDLSTGKKINEIELPFFPVDFTYDNGCFYLAGTQFLFQIDKSGRVLSKLYFGDKILFVNDMKVIGDRLYLISPDQRSWYFDNQKHLISHFGVVLEDGSFCQILKQGKNQFQITLLKQSKESMIQSFVEKEPLGTVKVLGQSNGLLFVEIQQIINETPLKTHRVIRAYALNDGRLEKAFEISMPDVSYTYVKHDVRFSSGKMNFLITTPQNANMFELNTLTNFKSGAILKFPDELYQETYHYNNHLPAIIEKDIKSTNSTTQQSITRDEIIKNAQPYATHKWYCHDYNIKNYDCGGEHVVTPSWVVVGNNIAVSYMWGGFSSIPEFDQGLLNGVSAGDSYTHGNGSGSSCAVGVDCSGFVSQVWKLSNKFSTATLPQISTAYAGYDELLPGDIVNYPHHHVRLIHTNNGNGSFLIIEASGSGTNWRVGYNNYSTADLQGNYVPRHYNYITNIPRDTVKPTTNIQVDAWQSGDFKIDFLDQDNRSLSERFYQLCYFDGNCWKSNTDKGFFNDDFSSGISPDWKAVSGDWVNVGGAITQIDETLSNPNIYVSVVQKANMSHLIQWKMKIGGSGNNRRAGIFFMCDDPTLSQRNNAYMVYFRVDGNKCQIYKAENNSIDLKTSDFCKVDADTWFDAKVIFNSKSGEIKVYKDNVLVSSWIDAAPLTDGNSISLRTGDAWVSYDNMKVYQSRTDTAWVTVGKEMDIPVQNTKPTLPACMIFSLVSDSAGNLSAPDSVFVNVDTTRPGPFEVADGTDYDIDTAYDNKVFSAHWTPSVDSNSGIAAYFYAIGGHPFSGDVLPWTNNHKLLNFTQDYLNLQNDSSYFVSVYAENQAGLQSDTMVSDGILILKPNGIHQEYMGQLQIFPQPARNYLMVVAKQPVLRPEVLDIQGNKIPIAATRLSDKKWKIMTDNLRNGIYLLYFKQNTQLLYTKFIIRK